VTILLVCTGEQRLNRLESAIHSAGFRIVSAQALDQAWARPEFFDFCAVVIDHELNDIAASAFRQRFITLNLDEDAAPKCGDGTDGTVQTRSGLVQ
jgi:hypothetical protein